MSGVVQKKVRNFLTMWRDLHTQYSIITQSDVDSKLRQHLTNLYEFDRLCYSYYALKSYYDLSKSRLDLDYRNLLDDLAALDARIEDKIPLVILFSEFPQLRVLRRQLKENAKEGGKVAFLIVSLSADMNVFKDFLNTIEDANTPEPRLLTSISTTPTAVTAHEAPPQKKPQPQSASGAKTSGSNAQKLRKEHQTPQPSAQAAEGSQTQHKPKAVPEKAGETVPSAQKSHEHAQRPEPNHKTQAPTQKPITPQKRAAESTTPKSKKKLSGGSSSAPRKQNFPNEFEGFRTWTREHDICIFKAATRNPVNPNRAIREDLEAQFGVNVSVYAAETLRLHYGMREPTMEKYQYYIQAFHLVAQQFHASKNYVTIPWAEIGMQFARRSDLTLEIWEIKGRYSLYLLHRGTYGSGGEPPLNYSDLHEHWKRATIFRNQSSRLPAKQPTPPNQAKSSSARLEFSREKEPVSVETENSIWTAPMLALLVKAHVMIPHDTPNRLLTIKHYIRLASQNDIDLKEIEERLKWKDVQVAIAKWAPLIEHTKTGAGAIPESTRKPVVTAGEAVEETVQETNSVDHSEKQKSANIVGQSGNGSASHPTPSSVNDGNSGNSGNAEAARVHVNTGSENDKNVGSSALESENGLFNPEKWPKLGSFVQTASKGSVVGENETKANQTHSSTAEQVQKQTSLSPQVLIGLPGQPGQLPAQTPQKVPDQTQQKLPAQTPRPAQSAVSTTQKASSPATPATSSGSPFGQVNHFHVMLDNMDKLRKPDWYYHSRIKELVLTDFWNFEKCKCLYVTVEYISRIPDDTTDVTLLVARTALKKVSRLRLLRQFKIKVQDSLIENKLMNFMEHDVFDAKMVAAVNRNLER